MNSLVNSMRKEIKFKVFFKDLGKLYSWIHNSSFKKSYPSRSVNSLYYDTPNLDFAASNISGETRRFKIRARWYTKPQDDFFKSFCAKNQNFKFELKRKRNILSDKKILSEVNFSSEDSINSRRIQLRKKIRNYIVQDNNLSKLIIDDVIFVRYNREYFEHFLSKNLRLTIDKNLICSKTQSFLNLNKSEISLNFVIVELKFNEKDSFNFNKIIQNIPFRQIRSSKYLYALAKYNKFSY